MFQLDLWFRTFAEIKMKINQFIKFQHVSYFMDFRHPAEKQTIKEIYQVAIICLRSLFFN
jgi:hypothetical protein